MASRTSIGSIFGRVRRLGAILGASWCLLGQSWGLLGRLGASEGSSWGLLWDVLGVSWGTSWGVLRAFQRLRAKHDEGHHSFGASWVRFQAHFSYALGAFFKDLFVVFPSYLEIA